MRIFLVLVVILIGLVLAPAVISIVRGAMMMTATQKGVEQAIDMVSPNAGALVPPRAQNDVDGYTTRRKPKTARSKPRRAVQKAYAPTKREFEPRRIDPRAPARFERRERRQERRPMPRERRRER